MVIKSKCRLYHATRLRQQRGREEVCWASPWKSLCSPRNINSTTTTVLRARPAKLAELFVCHSLTSWPVRALSGGCCCSHFTDEEVESQGLVAGLASLGA